MLIVEDGTGLATADSLVSIAEADAFHAKRNTVAWFAMDLASKEAKAREASDFASWNYNWKGYIPWDSVQALAFPRTELYDEEGRLIASNIVPTRVKNAVCLLAAAAEGGALQPATTTTSGALKRKRVGPLELEYFEGSGGGGTAREFPEVVTLLRGLLRGSPGGVSGSAVRWS